MRTGDSDDLILVSGLNEDRRQRRSDLRGPTSPHTTKLKYSCLDPDRRSSVSLCNLLTYLLIAVDRRQTEHKVK